MSNEDSAEVATDLDPLEIYLRGGGILPVGSGWLWSRFGDGLPAKGRSKSLVAVERGEHEGLHHGFGAMVGIVEAGQHHP